MQDVNDDGTRRHDRQPATKALEYLQDLRGRQLDGFQLPARLGHINQAFAGGKVGMYISGSDVYTSLVQDNKIEPDDYGVTMLPLRTAPTRACSAAAHRRRCAQRNRRPEGRGHEVDRLLLHAKLTDQDAAVRRRQDARRRQAAGRHPGAADLRPGAVRLTNTWIKPYVNVPQEQMRRSRPASSTRAGAEPAHDPGACTPRSTPSCRPS